MLMPANVGTAYLTISPRIENLEGSINKSLGGVNAGGIGGKIGGKFTTGFAAKMGGIAGLVSNVVSGAASAIGNSMSAAVSRLDTLNNFPRVMQNLGYGADEAKSSIKRLSDGIDGLPTSLDGIVSMTQQLAPMCGGLDKATTLSLALNDAFLAGGASTADQTRAMQQYSQMLAKGTVDLQSWRTLQEVMPGQLNQVSEALLGAGKNSNDLYEALKNGTITFDDFNNAIMQLDKQGVDGFASFADQAKTSTEGVGTAVENMHNRISKAIESVLDAIGQENISGPINAFSSSFVVAGNFIASGIEDVKSKLNFDTSGVDALKTAFDNAGQSMQSLSPIGDAMTTALASALSTIANAVVEFGTGFANGFAAAMNDPGTQAAIQGLVSGLQELAGAFDQLNGDSSGAVTSIGELVGWLGGGVVGVIAIVVDGIAGIATAVVNFIDFCMGIPEQLAVVGEGLMSIPEQLGGAWDAIVQNAQAVPGMIVALFSGIGQNIANFFSPLTGAVSGIFSNVVGFVSGIPGRIIGFFSNVGNGVSNLFQGIPGAVSNVFNSVVNFVQGIPGKVVGFFSGIGGRITSAIGSIHFPQPHVTWETLTVGNVNLGNVIPHVTWSAKGGIFSPNNPALLGLGDNRQYDEAAIPLSPSVLAGIGKGVADNMDVRGSDAPMVIAWLEENLPYIIEHYTPTIGSRDFSRMARKAVNA